MQKIYLDLAINGTERSLSGKCSEAERTVYAKQGDVGRKFVAVITDNGEPYSLQDGLQFSVWYSGTGGQGNYTSIGESSAFIVDGNTVTVELITQMLTNAGGGLMCLVIHDAQGGQIGLWNIRYVAEAVPGMGSQAAEQYYTAFSEAVKNLPYPDASLSAPGKAADAAAVGAALTQRLTAIEDANHPGCYYRTVDGVAEWINPPMTVGVEYRTMERSNGKVVYAIRVNPGSMVASGTVPVTLTSEAGSGGISVLRYSAQVARHALPLNVYDAWVDVMALSGTNVQVRMHTNETALVGSGVFVDIWYTKD